MALLALSVVRKNCLPHTFSGYRMSDSPYSQKSYKSTPISFCTNSSIITSSLKVVFSSSRLIVTNFSANYFSSIVCRSQFTRFILLAYCCLLMIYWYRIQLRITLDITHSCDLVFNLLLTPYSDIVVSRYVARRSQPLPHRCKSRAIHPTIVLTLGGYVCRVEVKLWTNLLKNIIISLGSHYYAAEVVWVRAPLNNCQ